MYWRLSTSKMREPWAMSMKSGPPPTPRKARTGEFTPPGMTSWARWKRASECFPMPGAIIDSRELPHRAGRRPCLRVWALHAGVWWKSQHGAKLITVERKDAHHGHTVQPRRLPRLHEMPGPQRTALLQPQRRSRRRAELDRERDRPAEGRVALRRGGRGARRLHPLQRPGEADDALRRRADADRQRRRAGPGPRRERGDARQAVRSDRGDTDAVAGRLHPQGR